MIKVTIYDLINGKIKRYGVCQVDMVDAQLTSGEGVLSGVALNPLTQYVDVINKVALDRPQQICTQDTDTILADDNAVSTFTNVEVGAEIFIDEISEGFEDDDGIVEIKFDTVGVYPITFSLFPFLDKEFVIHAN